MLITFFLEDWQKCSFENTFRGNKKINCDRTLGNLYKLGKGLPESKTIKNLGMGKATKELLLNTDTCTYVCIRPQVHVYTHIHGDKRVYTLVAPAEEGT